MILRFNTKSHLTKIGHSQKAADLFHDLCFAVSDVNDSGFSAEDIIDARVNRSCGAMHRKLDPASEGTGDILSAFLNEIQQEIQDAETRGLERGKDLLGQLNNGSITLDQFNKSM